MYRFLHWISQLLQRIVRSHSMHDHVEEIRHVLFDAFMRSFGDCESDECDEVTSVHRWIVKVRPGLVESMSKLNACPEPGIIDLDVLYVIHRIKNAIKDGDDAAMKSITSLMKA